RRGCGLPRTSEQLVRRELPDSGAAAALRIRHVPRSLSASERRNPRSAEPAARTGHRTRSRAHVLATSLSAPARTQMAWSRGRRAGGTWTAINDHVASAGFGISDRDSAANLERLLTGQVSGRDHLRAREGVAVRVAWNVVWLGERRQNSSLLVPARD